MAIIGSLEGFYLGHTVPKSKLVKGLLPSVPILSDTLNFAGPSAVISEMTQAVCKRYHRMTRVPWFGLAHRHFFTTTQDGSNNQGSTLSPASTPLLNQDTYIVIKNHPNV